MLHLRKEHMEAFRPLVRAQFPERVMAATKKEGRQAERDPETGDVIFTDKLGHRTRLSFYPDGLPSRLTLPSGATEHYEHDDQGRLAATTLRHGERIEFDRDQRGNTSKLKRPGLAEYDLAYDDQNQLTSVKYPDGSETRLHYHASGVPASLTDRTGNTTTYKRSSSGCLEAVVDPLGRETQYAVDGDGRLSTIIFPDSTEERYSFNPETDTLKIKTRDGNTVLQQLDPEGKLKSVTWPDGEKRDFKVVDGNLAFVSDQTGSIEFKHGNDGALLKEETQNGIADFERDAEGHLTRFVTPLGESVGYTYDEDGRPTLARAWGKEIKITYDADGSMEVNYGGCLVETRSYGKLGRESHVIVKNHSGYTLSEQSYTYDSNERLTGIIDRWGLQKAQNQARKFKYDAENRLIREIHPETRRPLADFAYDGKGNLTTDNGTTITVGPLDQPTAYGSASIRYDANGNMQSLPGARGEVRCRFSASGLLREAKVGAATFRFEYDALGRRTLKTDGTRSWRYFWAGHQLIREEEYRESSETVSESRDYLYFPNSVTPIAFRENGEVYWLQSDARGAVIRAFNEEGKEFWRASYESHGLVRVHANAIRQPWRLAGYYEDEETGLYYSYARYYSPILKSFLSRDPKWNQPQASNYSYTLNDPWNRADPLGALGPLLVVVGFVALSAVAGAGIGAIFGDDPVAGAIDGALSAVGTIGGAVIGGAIGFAVGGPPGAVAGAIVGGVAGGAIGSAGGELAAQAYRGDELCFKCAAVAGGISVALDIMIPLIGSKIPGLKQAAKELLGEVAEKVAKEALEESAEQAAKGGAKETAEKALKEAGGEAAEELTKKQVGDLGEEAAIDYLKKEDYTEIRQVQNNSGHGIDIVAKSPEGKWTFFEVKATTGDKTPSLSKAQSKDPQGFVKSRLERAAEGKGHWENTPTEQQSFADDLLHEIEDSAFDTRKINVLLNKDGTTKSIGDEPWKKKGT